MTRNRHNARRGRRWSLGLGCATLVCGCSVEQNRDVLSFFFDGVPGPQPATTDAPGGAGVVALADGGRPVSFHTAYTERRCAECHGDRARFGFTTAGFAGMDEAVCVSCHGPEIDALTLVHGPVALGACLMCHAAHVSEYPALLIAGDPALCLGCHDPEEQGPLSLPAHRDANQACLTCHFGHGGDDRFFVRPGSLETSAGSEAEPADGTR